MTAGVPGSGGGRAVRWAAACLFLVVYLLPLGWRPLLLPDEFRYAEIPREMLASGDWVVPRLDGLLYFEKPALGYWLIAGSQALAGPNRFAVRLPSALAAGLAALVTGLAIRRGGGPPGTAAPLAMLVFLSSLLPIVVGTTAVLDMPLTLFVTGTLVAFFLATASPPRSRRELLLLSLAGVCCGLAFWTKGFLALALPVLVAGVYLLWQRRWRDIPRLAWAPALAAAAVAAPWSLAVHRRAPDFWRYFFWQEHVERFFGDNPAQHPEPWWFFLALTPLALLPWTFLLPAAVRGHRGREGARLDLARYCITWIAAAYLFFSLSSGKLATYILPALPPIAILLALGLAKIGERPQRRLERGVVLVGAVIFGLAAVGLAVYLSGPGAGRADLSASRASVLAAGLALVAAAFALAARAPTVRRATGIAAWAMVPLVLALQLALPQRVLLSKAPGAFLAAHRSEVGPQTIVISDANSARAACWILGRDDVRLLGPLRELSYGAERDTSDRVIDFEGARRLIAEHPGEVVLFTEDDNYRWWQALLPRPRSEESQGENGFVFATY